MPVVRRIEGAAENRRRPLLTRHDHDLVTDFDLGAGLHPGVAQGLVELLALRHRADDAESLAGAEHLEAAALGRLRPVLEEVRQLRRDRDAAPSPRCGAEREAARS